MKIVVLDGYTLNPGDISWNGLEKLGDLIVYDRTPKDKILERIGDAEIVFTNKALESETMKYSSLDEIFRNSDIISLHCPLFERTRGMINKNTIAKMKDGVIIINTSRGPLVVDEDLAEALNSGKVYAAGLDVVSTEPIEVNNTLLKAKNAFITPHIAWAPKESRQRLMDIAVNNLSAYLNGEAVNIVNK